VKDRDADFGHARRKYRLFNGYESIVVTLQKRGKSDTTTAGADDAPDLNRECSCR
jgi:hypothetical protein